MGLANGLYYAEDEDGERTLPKKDKEGKFHVEGHVQVASCKHAKQLVDNCQPIWDLLGESKKVLGRPLSDTSAAPAVRIAAIAPIWAYQGTGKICWETWRT
jgi:hypothetical protein